MNKNTIPLLFMIIIIMNGCVNQQAKHEVCDELLLKDYKPQSVFNLPETKVTNAKFPVVDMHSHPYTQSKQEIDEWVANMDQFGIECTILLTKLTGAEFDSVVALYSGYPDRFELWCGIDYTGFEEEGWPERAITELERCYEVGARGVGELGDKGLGLSYSKPTRAYGMHIDDSRMIPLFNRCAQLNMPVNIHVADPIWMYEAMDSTNDGMWNAYEWRIDLTVDGILNHGELIKTLENALKLNPETTFIASHFANCSYDLQILGWLLDSYPNLYADISARYGETATIPRYMMNFYSQYQDRLLYGTDMGFDKTMYESTFRILETSDEHFYYPDQYNYHWPLNGFDLPDDVLMKIYKTNAIKVLYR